jgi:TctA family transporter
MSVFSGPLGTAIEVVTLAVNAIALLTGTMLGAVLTPLAGRSGLHSAVPLVLVMPVAAVLDPGTGLILLGAMLASGLATTLGHDEKLAKARLLLLPMIAFGVALALVALSGPLATLIQGFSAADSVLLLLAAGALAVVRAAMLSDQEWRQAALLLPGGLALQLSSLAPLDAAHRSPLPVLLGLLVLGPALVGVLAPSRHGRTWGIDRSVGSDHADMPLSLLPAFLVGLPVTLIAAIFALNLGENGLRIGPKLMAQRPKIVLGLLAAIVVASFITVGGRWIGGYLPRSAWTLPVSANVRARILALVFALLGGLAAWKSGGLGEGWHLLALTSLVSFVALYFGLDLAPLVLGLVLGQLMQPLLGAAAKAAGGSPVGALFAVHLPVLLVTIAAVAAALAGPWLAARFGGRTSG